MAAKLTNKTSDINPEILMLGYLCVKGMEGLPEKVNILDRFGLADVDISIICDAAIGSIRNSRLQVRKTRTSK